MPSASEPRMRGDVQVPYVPVAAPGPSRRHSKLEPVSLEENANVAEFVVIVPVGPRVDRRVRRDRVDREGAGRGRRVQVAGGVAGADLERVGPLGQVRVRLRRRARRERRAVQAALERRARLGRGERERRRRVVGRAGRATRDGGVRDRRLDRERPRGGRGVHVAGGVGGAHQERVRAVDQRAERARRGAAHVRARRRARPVEAALEASSRSRWRRTRTAAKRS